MTHFQNLDLIQEGILEKNSYERRDQNDEKWI